jgi:hypothetical protein
MARDRMLKAEERKFVKLVVEYVRGLGARERAIGLPDDFEVDSKYGLLRVHPSEDSVYCRFEDVERAKAAGTYTGAFHHRLHGVDLNHFSGKWNHHFFGAWKAEDAFATFRRAFDQVMPDKP